MQTSSVFFLDKVSTFACRIAVGTGRGWLVTELIVRLLLSIYPALTVLAIQFLGSHDGPSVRTLILVSLVFGLAGALQQISYALGRRVATCMEAHVATELSRTLATAPPAWLRDPSNAALIRAARHTSIEGQTSSLYQAACNIVAALIVAVSLASSLWPISKAAAVCSVFAALPMVASYMWVGKKEAKLWPITTEKQRRALYLEDQLSLPRTSTELALLKAGLRFANLVAEQRSQWRRLKLQLEAQSMMGYLISGVATTIIIGATLFLLSAPGNTLDIAAGIVGFLSSITALGGVGFQIGELTTTRPAVRQLRTLLTDTPPALPPEPRREWQKLSVSHLSVTYPAATAPAVRDVSFTAERGTITAIVGANGSGKTTIINAIVDALPFEGEIWLDAERIQHSMLLGVQLQSFGTFEVTVRDFLCLNTTFTDEEVFEALRHSNAQDFVRQLPHGLDTQLGEQWGGVDLSGGQWQRLSLARLFLHDYPVWLLDEPTSAVDAYTEEQLFSTLKQAKATKIIVVITHRASVLQDVDNIIVLEHGQIVEQGTFTELCTKQGPFARLFRNQIQP